ncbi:restriction endonuclease subunit S [Glaesserella parasuis]|uniref:restriction endonuclease subunit S n=1 Tax=Glaesserella parasuis TaxID=738 RepID=UPI00131202A6|nr:restriction endonuclease subunit S [Glaesserella parasuis]MDG6465294.1 restriction endonuclease subunit S [Glaesserella parasuis]MDO9979820.1 restriction endonuclease subunit S [Glaesserella parasuis]MDO9990642.1 restriction endonuclease subunit S [Glaesserella parasuis]MDP0001193.1 restriction endonuclease subunit S [Glaesserella parasuis]MDP0102608.1 restriction endonuclease subunit S [Glaesserella parasuis]
MSSWKQVRFSEICDITRGGSPRPIQEYMTNDGVPWIKISDATASNSRFIEKTKEFIKTSGISKSREVFPDDLILSNSATPGIPKFMRIYACIHDGWLLLRNFNGAEKEFIYWLLLNERDKLIQQGNGSVFTNLKTDILKNHIVNIPDDIEEQKRIATILNNIQEKIELNTQINQTLEQIAQTIFKSWFIDFDPVHAKANALASGQTLEQATQAAMAVISGKNTQELHRLQTANPEQYQQLWEIADTFPSGVDEEGVPWGWEERYLKDVCNIVYGKNLPTSELKEQGYPVFGGNGVIGFYDKYLYDKPHTLVSCRGAASGKVIYSLPNSFVTNNSLVIEHSKSYLSSFYVYEALSIQNLTKLTSGSAQPQMTIANMNPVQIIVPTEKAHSLYFNFVKGIYDKKLYGLYENEVLSKIRNELLPKLLSGEILNGN